MNRWSGWSSERLHSAHCAAARQRGGVWCWQSSLTFRCNIPDSWCEGLDANHLCCTEKQHICMCCMYPPAYASIRQHMISTRPHTSAHVSIQRRYYRYFVLLCVTDVISAIFFNCALSHAKMKGVQARDRLTKMPPPSVPRFESFVNEDAPENVDGEHWVL